MSSVSGIRMPGLATGMDTEAMVKEMLAGNQSKIDKAKQKEQTIKWQQEIYREVIKDIKGFQDNYFSVTSPNSIISSNAWNTLSVNSSNSNVITATGGAGANKVDYSFDVRKLAESAKLTSSKAGIKIDSTLSDLGATPGDVFKISLGKDAEGNDIYSNEITIEATDTIQSLMKKINDSTDGKVKASYSEMIGKFTIETTSTGSDTQLSIVDSGGNGSNSLNFLVDTNSAIGSDSIIDVKSKDGTLIKTLNEKTNSFTIDNITYDVHTTGTSEITSKEDATPVVENMKKFVEDYNKIMDKVYDLVTQKTNKGYHPLTEEQKKDMSDEEIERWEKKAKEGLIRNDSEMRRFMDHMNNAIFGENADALREFGLTSHEDYTKRGQLALDEEKFTKEFQNNGQKMYEIFAQNDNSVLEKMKDTMYDYVGTSSSVFAKKAGIEKTASVAKNFYSDQIKRQEETIKMLQRKMDNKENKLYKQFGQLEASMNKLNSQMNYFMQM